MENTVKMCCLNIDKTFLKGYNILDKEMPIMIVDFHTHIFPDKIAERTIEVLEQNIIKLQGKKYAAVIAATLDALKISMKESGVTHSLVLPIATAPKQTPTINRFAAEINGKDNIYSFGSLHPSQEDYEEVLEGIKESGLLGIKLHPEYQQFYVDSPESIRILQKCEELGLYTVFHAGNDVGVEPPVHCAPERLARVLDYVKGDKIIAAHLGGWRDWDEVKKHLAGTPILFDTAFISPYIDRSLLLRIIEKHGSEKILFATDSPWQGQAEAVRYFSELGLEQNVLDNIFYKNAQKILNLC